MNLLLLFQHIKAKWNKIDTQIIVMKEKEKKSLTKKGEPGEEGGRTKVEQWQKYCNKVQRDGVGFIPPVVKQCCVCIIITVIMLANAAVIIWIRTNHWKR